MRDENQAEEVDVAGAGGNEKAKAEPRNGGSGGSGVVPYYRLFSQADALDYLLMLVGGAAAVAHGASFPVFLIFLGKLIDSLGAMSADMPNQVIKVAYSAHSSLSSLFLSDF